MGHVNALRLLEISSLKQLPYMSYDCLGIGYLEVQWEVGWRDDAVPVRKQPT